MTILAIETSCDDSSVAILRDRAVLSNLISSQPIHDDFGGIVPDLAAREHLKAIGPLTAAALRVAEVDVNEIDAIAVTFGPGLHGSLVVGSNFAKALGLRLHRPVYPIHHIEAHLFSAFLEHPELPFPAVVLVVSGGHTSIFHVTSMTSATVLGNTKDDAAGEAFDKIAKMMGLGYPGGPIIDGMAQKGQPDAITFPRGLLHDSSFDFSFSGLKTSVKYWLRDHGLRAEHRIDPLNADPRLCDVAASAQRAIVDVLVQKTLRAAERVSARSVAIVGGVSANTELRRMMAAMCNANGLSFAVPSIQYSIDNAAMIGFLAAVRLAASAPAPTSFSVAPNGLRSR
ncbi:MAG TPA: tRNA (adenosine(37)-N6)-threonylcarbamoyltransferase complex transferase subunit TsaD [Bacteroidetes bacterium]|nr:tRNA (adenosine(37)-N6)-threonylcarbamoyltransferase complex transferase subunit TsaD [Bacteroidota bacterium]HRK06028.1 tRNA (adenosine(37)-N6)-threonylcarbamoyltransferase complex transferase subunit TsaD [Chlorobiota bacterium]